MSEMADEYPESDLTGKIIGAALKVHKKLGPGFVEKVYHRALATELRRNSLKIRSQAKTDILYEGGRVGFQAIDFIVENKVVLELKAVSEILDVHVSQVISYLKAAGPEIGLILNFAKSKLEIRRVINSRRGKGGLQPLRTQRSSQGHRK